MSDDRLKGYTVTVHPTVWPEGMNPKEERLKVNTYAFNHFSVTSKRAPSRISTHGGLDGPLSPRYHYGDHVVSTAPLPAWMSDKSLLPFTPPPLPERPLVCVPVARKDVGD